MQLNEICETESRDKKYKCAHTYTHTRAKIEYKSPYNRKRDVDKYTANIEGTGAPDENQDGNSENIGEHRFFRKCF